ncbi:hypothetical protein [Galbibacter sp. PAP.153]|uniref:hypothetical protein n=1 Tax=Galbibacter sp. PAP.153 TaxID=3104623 RepID=UPI00300B85AF
MKNGLKHSITYLFLALFLTVKLAGLHVILHSDDKDHLAHCIVCDHAIANEHTPVLPAQTQEITFENIEVFVERPIIQGHYFHYCSQGIPNQLFSRPPPIS